MPKSEIAEQSRLRALEALKLGREPEERFDRITRLARQVFRVPVVAISIVDAERVWYKAVEGAQRAHFPREATICNCVVDSDGPLIVRDALEDPLLRNLPPVCEDGVRFYAGHPLRAANGHTVGSVCLLDTEPREFGPDQVALLVDIAALVETELWRLDAARLRDDIEHHRSEYERVMDERMRFFDLSLDLLCIADFDGYFKQLNPAWESVLGYTSEELLSKPFVEFVHPDDIAKTAEESRRIAEGELTVSFENRYLHKDGSYRHLLWAAAPSMRGKRIFAVARDITDRNLAAEELALAKSIAEEARMKADAANRAKSEFLANMSHELRTPLNSVIGFAHVLLKNKDGTFSPEALDYLRRIMENGRHLLGLINSVLDLSKVEVGGIDIVKTPVQLGPLIVETIAQLAGQAEEKGLRLMTDLPEHIAPLRTDPIRLRQILINLVGNAIKFTHEGHVSIELTCDPHTHSPLRLDVVDTGIGIPRERLSWVFGAFQQVHTGSSRFFGGTGLGLSISNSLAVLLGFQLSVDSEPGAGSTFSVHFVPGSEGAKQSV